MSCVLGRLDMLSEIRSCVSCQTTKTSLSYRDSKGHSHGHWHHKPEGWLCKKCYMRIYNNPKWNPIWNSINSPRKITFTPTGRVHILKENPRTGVCSRCFRSKARGEITRTNMHHTSYDPTDVLANTMELCVSCHRQLHPQIRTLTK